MEYLTRLNDLKCRNLKIERPLKERADLEKALVKEIEGNVFNTLIDLSDNTRILFEMADQHKKVYDDTLDLLEVACKKLENLEALAVYRDFISLLVLKVKKRLGYEVWVDVRFAINWKRNYKKVDFKESEKDNILRLKEVLSEVDISVEEFELLMALKDKSNCEFHKGDKDAEEVKRQIETSLPNELQGFKEPLRSFLAP